jgi:rhodanese-related sulfurtransferase
MGEALPVEIDVATLDALRRSADPPLVLDVREPWEVEICALPDSLTIPLGSLAKRVGEIPAGRSITVLCHHGGRSAQATHWLRDRGLPATNVAGGIDAWARRIDLGMAVYP